MASTKIPPIVEQLAPTVALGTIVLGVAWIFVNSIIVESFRPILKGIGFALLTSAIMGGGAFAVGSVESGWGRLAAAFGYGVLGLSLGLGLSMVRPKKYFNKDGNEIDQPKGLTITIGSILIIWSLFAGVSMTVMW